MLKTGQNVLTYAKNTSSGKTQLQNEIELPLEHNFCAREGGRQLLP